MGGSFADARKPAEKGDQFLEMRGQHEDISLAGFAHAVRCEMQLGGSKVASTISMTGLVLLAMQGYRSHSNMSYVVLARKWRPQIFDDLVGQEHVSRTLGNAIESDRVAHAFLFTGVRGVGKTTSARILAKALNCANGPTPTPCLKCSSCLEIGAGTDVDVQEIDGASYTGVNDVRKLQESLPYRPARDRFKIYIVDEVHMLSSAAWNAFLKTLEEPPPHVKFIFATTEAHKVPVTILSRCQRYDFKLIAAGNIVERLQKVLAAEGIDADAQAVHIIAREAAGSMRDAMSLLDQVIAWVGVSGDKLTTDSVARVLGVASRSVLHRLGAAVVRGDASAGLDVIAELANEGYDLTNVARDFLSHLRDLVVAKVSQDASRLIESAEEELNDLAEVAESTQAEDLSRVFLGFSRAYDDIVRSGQSRAAFEMALVRLAQRPALVPVDDLMRKLVELERRMKAGAQGPPGGTDTSPKGGAPTTTESSARDRPDAKPSRDIPSAPRQESSKPQAGRTARADRTSARVDRASSRPAPDAVSSSSSPRVRDPQQDSARRPATQRPDPAAATKPSAAERNTPREPVRPSVEKRRAVDEGSWEAWKAILGAIAKQKPAVASMFQHGSPLRIEAGVVQVAFPPGGFATEHATSKDARELVAAIASAHFGEPTQLEIDVSGEHADVQTVAEQRRAEKAVALAEERRGVEEHPMVQTAIEVFDAEIRDIRLPE